MVALFTVNCLQCKVAASLLSSLRSSTVNSDDLSVSVYLMAVVAFCLKFNECCCCSQKACYEHSPFVT